MAPGSSKKAVLAIAVDFGTTFSGIAYGKPGQLESCSHIEYWPVGPGGDTEKCNKVPTVVSYKSKRTAIGEEWVPDTFGVAAQAAPPGQSCSLFKMCWKPNSDTYSEMSAGEGIDVWRTWERLGKSVEDVIKDFLQLLFQHMVSTLAYEGLGENRIDYNTIFTVPAGFSPNEVQKFKSIVQSTGWGNHAISVSLREPEAAILYTINKSASHFDFQTGQCIVLCDAGGGTVDIASYKVTQVRPRILLEQLAVTTGESCGSILIDHRFKEFLRDEALDERSKALISPRNSGNNGWEHLLTMCDKFKRSKERFTDSPAVEYLNINVSPNYLSGPYVRNGRLSFPRQKMREFFQSSIDGTIRCLDQHMTKCKRDGFEVDYIFLVGGLGSSLYLHKQVMEYTSSLRSRAEILKPVEAEYAVIRGALLTHQSELSGMPNQIPVKLCPANYGVVCRAPWDPTKHKLSLDEQVQNVMTKQVMAKNQVSWLIKKGERITKDNMEPLKREFIRRFQDPSEDKCWKDDIVMCDLDDPPFRLTKDVKRVCVLKSDMNSLETSSFTQKKSAEKKNFFRHKKYYQCDFDIVLHVSPTDLEFEMVFKGRTRSELLKIDWSEAS